MAIYQKKLTRKETAALNHRTPEEAHEEAEGWKRQDEEDKAKELANAYKIVAEANTLEADVEFKSYDRTAPKGKGTYTIQLTVAASRLKTIQKEADKAFGKMLLSVTKVEIASSRGDRLAEAEGEVQNAKSTVEELKDELQEWYDVLPESFQGADKGQALEEAVSNLDALANELDGIDFSSVDFPSMY